ncbi:hypothetical protein Tco_0328059 [Tanacetum coccineum]
MRSNKNRHARYQTLAAPSASRRSYLTPPPAGEGSTVPVESHHTPTGAPSTSQTHLSPTLRSSIKQETEVPHPSSPLHTNVADEAASTGVDVRYRGATTTATGLEAG